MILSVDKEYEGIVTHREAVIEAFRILNTRNSEWECDYIIEYEKEKIKAYPSNIEELLQLPYDDYYDNRLKKDRAFSIPSPMPYWFAFLEPPQGNSYLIKDCIEKTMVIIGASLTD